jgi:hypothetical protein
MSSVFRDTMEARRSGRVAADCKSVLKRLVGSNLTASTKIWLDRIKVITSDCLSDYRGSIPRRVARQFQGSTAVVQKTVNLLVAGSIPALGANFFAPIV